MRLRIDSIDITDIKQAEHTHIRDHVLYVCFEELQACIMHEESRIAGVDIDIVRPGDRVRIPNLLDIVQPRCKVEEEYPNFPGFVDPIRTAGHGTTVSLRGMAVLVPNPHTERKYSAFLDMAGPAAELSMFARMPNIVISPRMADSTNPDDFEHAVKIAGLRTAVYLARAGLNLPPDESELFELDMSPCAQQDVRKGAAQAALPRIGYYYSLYSPQHDHKGISDRCLYGAQATPIMPTILHPNEILDGGVTGHYTMRSLCTYTIQNHPVIREMYKRNGKELRFAGVVAGVANMEASARERKVAMAGKLMKEVLAADGCVLSKVHGGMPHVDLSMVAGECERLGIKTVLFVQPTIAVGTLSDIMLFRDERLDAIVVTSANFERVKVHFAPDRIIGGNGDSVIFSPDPIHQVAGQEDIVTEGFLIAGVHDQIGGRYLRGMEY